MNNTNQSTVLFTGHPPYRKPTPTFTVDAEWLSFYTNKGGITSEQATELGVSYPVKYNWMSDVVGKRITDEQRFNVEILWNLNRMAKMREREENKFGVVISESSADYSPSKLDLREDSLKLSHDEIEYRPEHGTKAWQDEPVNRF